MSRIAIIGARGLLGTELVLAGEKLGLPVIRADISTDDLKNYAIVDITNPDSLAFFFDAWNPEVVINCAAYTKVDDAEDEYAACMKINAMGVENLARICRERKSYLVQISTDYVYGGSASDSRERVPYDESENCEPCGIYGWSKYFGERSLANLYPENSAVIRTSWLHGTTGPNFIKTILRVAKEKDELKVVNDQYGSITWAPWLASVIYKIIDKRVTGIVHACASDATTWYDIARDVIERSNLETKVGPQTTAESGRKAPRPLYSKLNTKSLSTILDEEIPINKDFIDQFMKVHQKG